MSELANRLRFLSDHLTVHPHLPEPVSVVYGRQIHLTREPADLLAWARTLGSPLMEVRMVTAGDAHFQATGTIFSESFTVWCSDWRRGSGHEFGNGPISVDMFERYVQRGVSRT